VKAVPQPQLRKQQPPPTLPAWLMPNFVGGEPEWLKLNSDLPSLTTLKTVGDLEEGFLQRLLRVRDFIFYLGSTTMDWRVLNVYLYYCDANGGFLPDRTIDQNGRIKRQGGGIWSGMKKDFTKKENTDLVGHYLTRETRRETADQTIATYLGMTQEEKERELRRILISMDLILEVAEKKKCWRAAATYLKMVDYDGSFLPMSSAVRDRWEKTYGRHVDNWEKLEKQQAEKVKRAEKVEKAERVVPSPARPKAELVEQKVQVQQEIKVQNSESEIVDNREFINETPAPSDENNGLIRLRVNVAPIDRIREAVKNPVHEAPVSVPSEAEIEALAAERARQAREDKLNAAIPGRKFRKQGKLKPGALTPRPNSATHHAKGQPTGPSKGKNHHQKVQPAVSAPKGFIPEENQAKTIDYQTTTSKQEGNPGKAPP
jgi:hypothetical protein